MVIPIKDGEDALKLLARKKPLVCEINYLTRLGPESAVQHFDVGARYALLFSYVFEI